jgi:hypothetical protein
MPFGEQLYLIGACSAFVIFALALMVCRATSADRPK